MEVVELYIIKFKTVNFVPLVSCVSKDCKQLNLISLIPFDFCFREVVANFTLLTRGLAMELLRLLSEGMGLPLDVFEGDLTRGDVTLDINHYPPCPNPSTTLGLPPHCDQDLMAILLPGQVPGLEVAYKGDWIKVQPVPLAFVVNFGQQLEVVTKQSY